MAHINLSREADAVLVAPASADFMAKLLHGRADDLLSLLCLARPIATVPLLIAPAIVGLSVGTGENIGVRWVISLVATAIIVIAVVVSKRRPIAVGDTQSV
jgi:3-polyprenyl-4-hydroxybenzoate decarboxylase